MALGTNQPGSSRLLHRRRAAQPSSAVPHQCLRGEPATSARSVAFRRCPGDSHEGVEERAGTTIEASDTAAHAPRRSSTVRSAPASPQPWSGADDPRLSRTDRDHVALASSAARAASRAANPRLIVSDAMRDDGGRRSVREGIWRSGSGGRGRHSVLGAAAPNHCVEPRRWTALTWEGF